MDVMSSPDSEEVLKGLRVLLFQESDRPFDSFTHLLEDKGANITPAATLPEAFEAFERVKPDILVSTIATDESRRLIQVIRTLPPEFGGCIPALAFAECVEDIDRATRAGYQDSMVIPASPDRIFSKFLGLANQIEKSRKIREQATAQRHSLAAQRVALKLQQEEHRLRHQVAQARFTSLSIRKTYPAGLDSVQKQPAVPIANILLISIPAHEYARLQPHMEPVLLQAGHILYTPGQHTPHVYFPAGAVVSLLKILEGKQAIDLGPIGSEGMVGPGVNEFPELTAFQAQVLIGGQAVRIESRVLREELENCPGLQRALFQHIYRLLVQSAQVAACNVFHTLEARVCRWLLALEACSGHARLSVTHEMISQALGSRRAGVTVALGHVQTAGAINLHRGNVHILDLARLEEMSCECYRIWKTGR